MVSRTSELLQRDGVALVFGMEWFPLLGNHPTGQARSLARRRRASHRVIASGAAASVGLLRAGSKPRKRHRLCSAAAVFAGLHPTGTVAAILPLPSGRQWLVAVHEGAVMTRTDQLHDCPASAQGTVSLLREAHPGLLVHDENRAPSGLLDALFKAAREQGELLRTPPLAGLSWAALFSVGVLALVLMAGRGPFHGGETGGGVQEADPRAAWRDAVALALQRHTVHGVAGLRAVLDTLHAIPVYLAGWLLTQAECRPGGAEWQCRANYRRDEAGDNQSLVEAARFDWTLSFDPMEGAVATWSAAMPAMPLADVRLRGTRQNETRLVSALQAMLPAFSEFRVDAPQPLPVVAPLDMQQRPIPRPAGIAGYQRRSIQLQAPLRSLSLLLPETSHMSWQRVALQVAVVDQPSLRSSSLRVSLSGVLYEIDDPSHVSSLPAVGTVGGVRD